MAESNLPAPQSALEGSVSKPSQNSIPADQRRIEVGGGLYPRISCSVKDVFTTVAAALTLLGGYFFFKYEFKRWFGEKNDPNKKEKDQEPEPPKVQPLVECVSTSGGPKPAIIPGLLYQGGIAIVAGRTGIGKSLFVDQLGVEAARGYGEFIPTAPDGSTCPRAVIIIDGEMEDDDYAERFPDPSTIPGNITRISECDFETTEQLTNCVRGIVSGLLNEVVIVIDNIAALVKNPTASDIYDLYRELRKIQRETSIPVSFIVANHLAKVPEGQPIDESNLAGSANLSRFASGIAIIDKSARGKDYRFLKILKERKKGQPAEVIELEYSEDEYKHFNFFGTIPEDEVLYTKTNRKHFDQEADDEDPGENDEPESEDGGRNAQPWTDKDTKQLRELAQTLETPYADVIAEMMGRNPVHLARKAKEFGVKLMSKPRGRKPKPKDGDGQEQNQEQE